MLASEKLARNQLWLLACRFARCMFDLAQRNPLVNDRHVSEQTRRVALRLTAKIFEACEATSADLETAHLAAAERCIHDLRHFLSIADRTGALPATVLDRAHELCAQLRARLQRLDDPTLAEIA